jgi:hypothetical protein
MNEEMGSGSEPQPNAQYDPGQLPAPMPSSPQRDVYRFETIDVTRLSELLTHEDDSGTKALGEAIIKALITDVLRARLGYSDSRRIVAGTEWRQSWDRTYHWDRVVVTALTEVSRVIQGLVADVSLSDDELEVVKQLDIKLQD